MLNIQAFQTAHLAQHGNAQVGDVGPFQTQLFQFAEAADMLDSGVAHARKRQVEALEIWQSEHTSQPGIINLRTDIEAQHSAETTSPTHIVRVRPKDNVIGIIEPLHSILADPPKKPLRLAFAEPLKGTVEPLDFPNRINPSVSRIAAPDPENDKHGHEYPR